jgi:hypothetical protein
LIKTFGSLEETRKGLDYFRSEVKKAGFPDLHIQLIAGGVPNASIGWDDTPRFPHKTQEDVVHFNQSPQSFAAFLQKAKAYCDKHPEQPKLITVYAWNEWVEGAYLLPDMKYGFDYLDAVKDVMIDGKYERYTK